MADKIHTVAVKGATRLGVAVTGPHAGKRVHKTGVGSIWLPAGDATPEELAEAREACGMSLSGLLDELRTRFGLKGL